MTSESRQPTWSHSRDVVIVGSGPTGSACAGMINDKAPNATVLFGEAGPAITNTPAQHSSTIADRAALDHARATPQGPFGGNDASKRGNRNPLPTAGRTAVRICRLLRESLKMLPRQRPPNQQRRPRSQNARLDELMPANINQHPCPQKQNPGGSGLDPRNQARRLSPRRRTRAM
jgi:choline dehydrogenase-like flavoprotein